MKETMDLKIINLKSGINKIDINKLTLIYFTY